MDGARYPVLCARTRIPWQKKASVSEAEFGRTSLGQAGHGRTYHPHSDTQAIRILAERRDWQPIGTRCSILWFDAFDTLGLPALPECATSPTLPTCACNSSLKAGLLAAAIELTRLATP
jgi:hypothetical protein